LIRETALPDLITKSTTVQGVAGELWRKTLARIPTAFGRLVFVASLRNPVTGRYHHEEIDSLLGPADAEKTLRHSHHQVFSQWLVFSLADQKADLDEYLQEKPLNSLRYQELPPPTAREVETQLYLTDLETLLELIRCERSVAFSIPAR
jgi:hypothetical protein